MKHPLQQAEFAYTVANDSQLPPPGSAEVAFAGRSNAGKSSAINALANQTRLAFTSKTPGRTQQINFFRLRNGAMLADLPGYGYAAVPLELKRHWQEFLARYLATRQSLVGLVVVIDARHGLAEQDAMLLAGYLPSSRPVLLLATKMDKLTASGQRAAAVAIRQAVLARFPEHASRIHLIPFSAKRHLGIADAEALVGSWIGLADVPAAAGTDASARSQRDGDRTAPPATGARSGSRKEKAPQSRGVTRGPKRPVQRG